MDIRLNPAVAANVGLRRNVAQPSGSARLVARVDTSDSQVVREVPVIQGPACPKNHWERICRATGAAALAPRPPCSTLTTTTIGFDVAVAGTNPAYQASSCWPLIWALPVAP